MSISSKISLSSVISIVTLVSSCFSIVSSSVDATNGVLVKDGKICATLPSLDTVNGHMQIIAKSSDLPHLTIGVCSVTDHCEHLHSLRLGIPVDANAVEAVVINVVDQNGISAGRFSSLAKYDNKFEETPCCVNSSSDFVTTFIAYQTVPSTYTAVEFIWIHNILRDIPSTLQIQFILVGIPDDTGHQTFTHLRYPTVISLTPKFKSSAQTTYFFEKVDNFPFDELSDAGNNEYFVIAPEKSVTDDFQHQGFQAEFMDCIRESGTKLSTKVLNKTNVTGNGLTLGRIYSGCRTKKGCIGENPECVPINNCSFLITYNTGMEGYYRMELQTEIPEGHGYVAMGLSRDLKMGDDLVVACSASPSGKLLVYISWNYNYKNIPFPNTECEPDTYGKISKCNITIKDGRLLCNFYQKMYIVAKDFKFNIRYEDFHIMIAVGSNVTDDGIIGYHTRTSVTPRKVNFMDIFTQTVDLRYDYAVHASLMVIVWLVIIPNSIFIARYFKESFTHIRFNGKCLWHPVHVFLNTTALLLSLISLWKAMYGNYRKKKIWPCEGNTAFHAKWGFVTTALMIGQTVMGWSYPSSSIGRKVFAFCHFFTGNIAVIMALMVIMTSKSVGLPCYAEYFIVAGIVWVVFWKLIMSYHFVLIDKIVPHKRKKDHINRAFFIWPMSVKLHTEAPFGKKRLYLLLYHFLGTFVLSFAFLIMYWVSDKEGCYTDVNNSVDEPECH